MQIGIGGWIGNHTGVHVAERLDTTVITMFDVDERGVDGVMDIALEIALEVAWKDADAVYLSFDIDVFDPGFAPGTGTPEPGGMTSREGLQAARPAAREGLIGMDVVEISPPYDHADITAHLAARVIMDVLATLVEHGHVGSRLTAEDRARSPSRSANARPGSATPPDPRSGTGIVPSASSPLLGVAGC